MRTISLNLNDKSVVCDMEEIINTYEQDWDNDEIFYKIDSEGTITKINILTLDIYEYNMERVAN